MSTRRFTTFVLVMVSLLFCGGEVTHFEPEKVVKVNAVPAKALVEIIIGEKQDVMTPQIAPETAWVNKSSTKLYSTPVSSLAIENEYVPQNEISRAPASEINQKAQTYYWELSPLMSWKQLNSQDENQHIVSNLRAISSTNYGLSFSYGINFDESLKVFTNLETESVTFLDDSNLIELKNKKTQMNRVAVGVNLKSNWFFEVAMKDNLFLLAPIATTIDIQKVTLPEIKTKYKGDLYKFREASLSYAVSGNVFLPAQGSTINSKTGFGTGIILEARLRNQAFGMGYEKSYLKATGNSTSMDNIFWRFTWEAF